jgi:hypothetical protein
VCPGEVTGNLGELGLGVVWRRMGSKSSQGLQPAGAARADGEPVSIVRPDIVVAGEADAGSENAHHRERLVVEPEGAADYGRVPPEATAPEVVAQDRHRLGARHAVGLSEDPAERGRTPQHFEEVPRDERVGDPDRVRRIVVQRPPPGAHGGQVLEASTRLAEVAEVEGRERSQRAVSTGGEHAHQLQAGGLSEGKGREQYAVHHRENPRRATDSQGEGQRRGKGQHRPAPQGTAGIVVFSDELVQTAPTVCVASLLDGAI